MVGSKAGTSMGSGKAVKAAIHVGLFAAFIALWHLYTVVTRIPAYLLPSPLAVWQKFLWTIDRAQLGRHVWVTLEEILVGVAIGTVLGLVFGYLLGKSPMAERILSPYILVAQTSPKISFAPLFILWFGLGMTSKVVLVTLVVFFPIMVNGIVGMRSVDPRLYELMHLLKASRWQIFRALELPTAMASFLAGLRIATTQSMVAAIIGELMGAKEGLGYLLMLGHETFDITLVLVAVAVMSTLGLAMYLLVQQIECTVLRWRE